MRTIVGLAIVIAVIYGLYWVLKQVKASREESVVGRRACGTLATLPLGPNRSLHLVRAGREVVLVGVGEHGVTPIRTYTRARGPRAGPARPATTSPTDPRRSGRGRPGRCAAHAGRPPEHARGAAPLARGPARRTVIK